MVDGRLAGKTAIVTGGTLGIGRATAELFAENGANVIVNGRDATRGDEVVSKIRAGGGEAHFVAADVSKEEEVRELINAAVSRYGTLGIVVNNAAPTTMIRAKDTTVADIAVSDWWEIIGGVLTSAFMVCKYAIPELRRAGGGAIVNMSSENARTGTSGLAAYSAAKAGIEALTRSVANECAADRIRCNAILIGMIPPPGLLEDLEADEEATAYLRSVHLAERWGQPKDVGYGALYLACDDTSWVTGTTLVIDGGIGARGVLRVLRE